MPQKLTNEDNKLKIVDLDSTKQVGKSYETSQHLEDHTNEYYIEEWQTMAKILDRLLFTLNVVSMIIAFGYGYTVLYTY